MQRTTRVLARTLVTILVIVALIGASGCGQGRDVKVPSGDTQGQVVTGDPERLGSEGSPSGQRPPTKGETGQRPPTKGETGQRPRTKGETDEKPGTGKKCDPTGNEENREPREEGHCVIPRDKGGKPGQWKPGLPDERKLGEGGKVANPDEDKPRGAEGAQDSSPELR
jgi:hypothetical protein